MGWTDDWDDETGAGSARLGMMLTGFAVIMGAPFWFDLLNRLVGLRRGRAVPPRAAGDAASATRGRTPAQAALEELLGV